MTPKEYFKACEPYLAGGHANGKIMSRKLYDKLDKAYEGFTLKQKLKINDYQKKKNETR